MATNTHVELKGFVKTALPNGKLLGASSPDEWVELTVKLRGKAPLPPVTARHTTHLTIDQYAQTYGTSDKDFRTATAVFKKLGLHVEAPDAATCSLTVAGAVSDIEPVFKVKLFRCQHEMGYYRGRVGGIHIPAELDGIVEAVIGLDTRPMIKKRKRPTLHTGDVNMAAKVTRPWFFPAELARAYKFPAGDGSGQTVALAEFGGGYFADDLAAFCNKAGVAVPTVKTVSILNTPTNVNDDVAGEVMLDVEVVAGVCPKSKIVVYFSKWSTHGWVKLLDTVLTDKTNAPKVLSISYGLAEDQPGAWAKGEIDTINKSLQAATLLGVTVLISSGDDGSDDQVGDGHAHVDFPSCSPYVLSVGGTSLKVKGSTLTEKAWKDGDGLRRDNGGATGGGVSCILPRPDWQKTVKINNINPGALNGRVMPDVSADASGNTGYFMVISGQGQIVGGTSAATPLWASLIALINAQKGKPVGYITPLFYTTTLGATCCNPVTTGNNDSAAIGGYSAGKGYNAATGWGSPNGAKIAKAL